MMKKIVASILFSLALTASANAACYQWSKTAANNANADPSINWAEGMSPSSVNDSARAMMARLKECRDDVSGQLVTTGTSSAYLLTTNQGYDTVAHLNGEEISFLAHATNAAGATLNVDGLGAYPLVALDDGPAETIRAGTLVFGTSYTAVFFEVVHEWRLKSFFGQPFAVPLGAMLPYTGASAPNSNFIIPIGQCISRTTYATYFALVGTTFGGCDGSTTFGAPDMRGRVPAGLDGGVGRMTAATMSPDGNTRGAFGGAQQVTLSTTNLPASGLSVPGLSVPALSVPALSVPALAIPSINIPGLSVPGLSIPGLSVPALSIPGLSVPALSIPSLSVSVTTTDTGIVNATSGFVTGVTAASGSGSASVTAGTSASARGSSGTTGTGTTGTGTTGTGSFTGTGTTGTGTTGTGTTGTGATAAGTYSTGTGSTGTGSTGTGTTGTGTTGNMGTGSATTVMQPTLAVNYILRVL